MSVPRKRWPASVVNNLPKDGLIALMEAQFEAEPQLSWPEDFGPWEPPRQPSLSAIRKVLRADIFGFGPPMDLDLENIDGLVAYLATFNIHVTAKKLQPSQKPEKKSKKSSRKRGLHPVRLSSPRPGLENSQEETQTTGCNAGSGSQTDTPASAPAPGQSSPKLDIHEDRVLPPRSLSPPVNEPEGMELDTDDHFRDCIPFDDNAMNDEAEGASRDMINMMDDAAFFTTDEQGAVSLQPNGRTGILSVAPATTLSVNCDCYVATRGKPTPDYLGRAVVEVFCGKDGIFNLTYEDMKKGLELFFKGKTTTMVQFSIKLRIDEGEEILFPVIDGKWWFPTQGPVRFRRRLEFTLSHDPFTASGETELPGNDKDQLVQEQANQALLIFAKSDKKRYQDYQEWKQLGGCEKMPPKRRQWAYAFALTFVDDARNNIRWEGWKGLIPVHRIQAFLGRKPSFFNVGKKLSKSNELKEGSRLRAGRRASHDEEEEEVIDLDGVDNDDSMFEE